MNLMLAKDVKNGFGLLLDNSSGQACNDNEVRAASCGGSFVEKNRTPYQTNMKKPNAQPMIVCRRDQTIDWKKMNLNPIKFNTELGSLA